MNRKRDIKLARFLSGEMRRKEEIEFRERVLSDQKRTIELKTMEKQWKDLEEKNSGRSWDSSSAWEKLHTRLDKEGLLLDLPEKGRRLYLIPYFRAAAMILLALALGTTAIYYGLNSNSGSAELQTVQTGNMGRTVDLPDGSRAYLNSGSEITYPEDFDQNREVQLTGEAYFEVMSDPENPFTVRSGKVVVSVLGTSFNVKQVARSRDVEVYVAKGKVRMSMEDSGAYLTLVKGEMGRSGRMDQVPEIMKDPNYLSWKTKDFKFVDAKLTEVLKELEESYHTAITLKGIEPEGLKITTSYSEQSLEAILETIGTAFGWSVHRSKDGYYLNN